MSRKKLEKLRQQARDLDDSPAKVAILEEAIRIADSLGDISEGLKLRDLLIFCAYFSGQEEKAFVAFAWSVGHRREVQDIREEHKVLFQYKMLLGAAPDFHSLELTTIRKMQEEFKRRLTASGYPLRVYYRAMTANARDLGLREEQDRFARLWKESPPDTLFACDACERLFLVDDSLSSGNYAGAMSRARPIFSGKMNSCNVPTRTYAIFLRACLERRDLKGAKKYFDLGYPLAVGDEKCLWSIRFYLTYLTRRADLSRGLRAIERHLPMVMRRTNPWQRMTYFSLAADFFERTAGVRPQTRKVRLPEMLAIHDKTERYSPRDLSAWFRQEAAKLALAFDSRNGNGHMSWGLARDRALGLDLPIPEPIMAGNAEQSLESGEVKKSFSGRQGRQRRKSESQP